MKFVCRKSRFLLLQPGGNDGERHIRFLRLFRSLRLLVEHCSQTLMFCYAGTHCGLMCLALFCTYGAIRLHGTLSVCLGWIGVNVTIFLAIIIGLYGNFNHSSKLALRVARKRPTLLHSKGRRAESKLLQREICCLQELRLRMGSAFFYDKILLLTTFQILLQNLVNLLLLQ